MDVTHLSELQQIAGDLDAFTRRFDGSELAAQDAVAVVELTTQLERSVHVVKSVAASVVASAGTWRGHGDRSKEEWLARTTGTTTGVATGLFTTGAALADLPKVAHAARRGALSPAQLQLIVDGLHWTLDAIERDRQRGSQLV